MWTSKVRKFLWVGLGAALSTGVVGTGFCTSDTLPTRILIIMDMSLSMAMKWEKRTRIEVARLALEKMVQFFKDSMPEAQLGLRMFGHRSPEDWRDCNDTRLEVPIAAGTHSRIREKVLMYSPRGVTPIALSLQKAASDFPASPGRNIIILLTDGEEACGGNPCAISQALQQNGIILKPFIVGLGLNESVIANLGCAGTLFNAVYETELIEILLHIAQRITVRATAQIDLLDEKERPSETNLPCIFFREATKIPELTVYHTLNAYGEPDTLYLDPAPTYNLSVYTRPPVHLTTPVELTPYQHTHIKAQTPTGWLELQLSGITIKKDVQGKVAAVIHTQGHPSVFVGVQEPATTTRYLAGTYRIDILTLPVKSLTTTIKPRHTTTITVTTPGILVLDIYNKGYGAVLAHTNNTLEKIYQLDNITGRILLAVQPGTYTVVFRPAFTQQMEDTRVWTVTVGSDQTQSLKIR